VKELCTVKSVINVCKKKEKERKQEAVARLKYKIVLRKQYPDIKIRECGLFVGTNTPFLGASPDGIIENTDDGKKIKGVLEIKCPASDKWRALSPDECC